MIKCLGYVPLYRPPPLKDNKLTVTKFLVEFSSYLENIILTTGDLIIVGDFNFHIDDPGDNDAKCFLRLLDGFCLKNHVVGPTHKNGHTLDLILTRSDSDVVCDVRIGYPMISDHFALHFHLECPKPQFSRKVISYRNTKDIVSSVFSDDI